MNASAALPRGAAAALVLAAACLVFMGVVMAMDEHVPVAIEPDAPLPAGVQVATFALG